MQYHFGIALKQIRETYQLTQRDMAEMLAMTRENYGYIERGSTRITPERFKVYICRLATELARLDINLFNDYPVSYLKQMAYRVIDDLAKQKGPQ